MAIEINNQPHRYRVRFWMGSSYRTVECLAWAFSAEDAEYQVRLHYKSSSEFHGVQYVGPDNPACTCSPGTCYCGASPPREG